LVALEAFAQFLASGISLVINQHINFMCGKGRLKIYLNGNMHRAVTTRNGALHGVQCPCFCLDISTEWAIAEKIVACFQFCPALVSAVKQINVANSNLMRIAYKSYKTAVFRALKGVLWSSRDRACPEWP
jgi:hypothetical protein